MNKNLLNTVKAMVINATNVMNEVTIVDNEVMVNGEMEAYLDEFMTNPQICDYAREVSKQVWNDFKLNGYTTRILRVEDKCLGKRNLYLRIGGTEHEFVEYLNADGSHRSLSSGGLCITCSAEELLLEEMSLGAYGEILMFQTYDENDILLVWDKEYQGGLDFIKHYEVDVESDIWDRAFARFDRRNNNFEWFDEDVLKCGDDDANSQYIEKRARSCAEENFGK